jgi:hypothetical protein
MICSACGIIDEAGGLLMVNPFASWLFNLMFWGAIITLAVLLYATYTSPSFIDGMNALIALGVVAVLSLFWPKY